MSYYCRTQSYSILLATDKKIKNISQQWICNNQPVERWVHGPATILIRDYTKELLIHSVTQVRLAVIIIMRWKYKYVTYDVENWINILKKMLLSLKLDSD